VIILRCAYRAIVVFTGASSPRSLTDVTRQLSPVQQLVSPITATEVSIMFLL